MLPHWSIRYVSTISTETQSALSMERVRKPPPPSANQWPENGGACYARPAGHGRNLGALEASNIRAAHCTQASLFPWSPPLWALGFTAASGETLFAFLEGQGALGEPLRAILVMRSGSARVGDISLWVLRRGSRANLAVGYAAQGHELVRHTALRAREACLS